jgi:hypothetical protein
MTDPTQATSPFALPPDQDSAPSTMPATQSTSSYVNDYTPPTTPIQPIADDSLPAMNSQNMPAWQPPAAPVVTPETAPVQTVAETAAVPATQSVVEQTPVSTPPTFSLPTPPDEMMIPAMANTPVVAPQPVVQVAEPSTTTQSVSPVPEPQPRQTLPVAESSQSLEDQNIFHLLGIESAPEADKESFLDELQEVIWQDFLGSDLPLLITTEEMEEFKKVQNKVGVTEEQRQSEMIEFLEKVIPDLEKIMLEKALELKEEIVRKRIEEMRAQYATQPEHLQKIQRAAELADQNQWLEVANVLNSVTAPAPSPATT